MYQKCRVRTNYISEKQIHIYKYLELTVISLDEKSAPPQNTKG